MASASEETRERLRKKLAKKKDDRYRMMDLEKELESLGGAVGGHSSEGEDNSKFNEALTKIGREVSVSKFQQLRSLMPKFFDKIFENAEAIAAHCEDYDPENSDRDRKVEKSSARKSTRETHHRSSSSSSSSKSPPPADSFQEMEADLLRGHTTCATHVYDYMSACLGLCLPPAQEPVECYDICVGEAVMGLCLLYGDYWRKSFDLVKNTMLKWDYFVMYCSTILVERDGLYFFNYLMRMAIIFEMAWYCFDNHYDYFDVARICTYRSVDFFFFRDEGDWPALKKAACVVAVATRPLRFVVTCPKNNVKSFAGVVKQLEEYATKGMVNMTKKERSLLNELKDQFQTEARRRVRPSLEVEIDDEGRRTVALLEYFKHCAPKGMKNITVGLVEGDEFTLCQDTIPDDTKHLEYALRFRELPKTGTKGKDVSRRKKNEEVIRERDMEFENLKRERRKFNKETFASYRVATGFQSGRRVGDPLPKRRSTRQSDNWKYIRYDKSYAEDIIDVYMLVMPSFLKSYAQQFIAPEYAELEIDYVEVMPEAIFLIERSYYKRRQELISSAEASKRMLAAEVVNEDYYCKGEIKAKPLKVLNIHLQRLLDFHIKEKTTCQRLKHFKNPILGVPRVFELKIFPTWQVKEYPKSCTTLLAALTTVEMCEDVLRLKTFRKSRDEEIDEAAVLKFRFRATAVEIPVPSQGPILSEDPVVRAAELMASRCPVYKAVMAQQAAARALEASQTASTSADPPKQPTKADSVAVQTEQMVAADPENIPGTSDQKRRKRKRRSKK